MNRILVLNSGSSSIKFALYDVDHADASLSDLAMRYQGQFFGLGGRSRSLPGLKLKDADGKSVSSVAMDDLPDHLDHHDALIRLLGWIEATPELEDITVVGHRVVHGGQHYHAPVILDDATLTELEALSPLAPLHQPYSLEPVKSLARQRPELMQVACFDTAFHTTQPKIAQQFALPRELTEKGLIRYGFHGLSYDYINCMLTKRLGGDTGGRVIAAHLGNGASLCAIQDGRSVASTTGFTALEGLPMGTRCGSLDPGLVLHLLAEEGMSVGAVGDLLYNRSGLLGVSGISSDMRELLASDAASAREAVELFVYRIAREIGSLAAAMGGLDHLVFTAGIGEHAAPVRQAVCEACEWLGLTLDDAANQRHATQINRHDSPIGAWVIPTDEERMIAWYSARLAACH
ncbi:acetate/propionate family kinase [Halomonas aquatica]|uniref:Acetate kinase n=1 Tax=Halomonas aquatica TaxID=3151123 RepID=A0ABV1NF91_9GAMM